MKFTITSTAETAPTPIEELPHPRSYRPLRRLRVTEPFDDWEGLAARIAADPEWAADVAFANRIAPIR